MSRINRRSVTEIVLVETRTICAGLCVWTDSRELWFVRFRDGGYHFQFLLLRAFCVTYYLHVVLWHSIAYNLHVVNTFFGGTVMYGKRLREVRMSRMITQQRMSEMVGVALRSYQCYEQGTRMPPLDMLVRLADALDISTDYLLCRDEFLARHADESL